MFLLFLLLPFANSFFSPGEMVIIRSKEHGMFTLIYKTDEQQNVSIRLVNEKGEKRLEHKVDNTTGFSLPLNMKQERTGTYTVIISADSESIQKEFTHTEYKDLIKEYFSYEYDRERHRLSVSGSEVVEVPVSIYVFNETGDQLIRERIKANHSVSRMIDLDGAPAQRLRLVIHVDDSPIVDERFDF